MGDALPPVALGAAPLIGVAATHSHVCALLGTGSIKCWGANSDGQLGLGDMRARGDKPGEMGDFLPILFLGTDPSRTDLEAVFLGAGIRHSCAVIRGGLLKCWGANEFGQLGVGDTLSRGGAAGQMGDRLPFVNLGEGAMVRQVVTAESHSCAVLEGGTIKCWGNNVNGELGLGDATARGAVAGQMGDALAAVDLGAGMHVVEASAGASHTCALSGDGRVKCWGQNFVGQLGTGDLRPRGALPGDMGDALSAVDLGGGRRAVAISAGARHACAILHDGSVRCWGDTVGGGDSSPPGGGATGGIGVVDIDLGRNAAGSPAKAIAIAAGTHHTCVALETGILKCWGDNQWGQLGLGDTETRGDDPGEMGDALPAVDLGANRTVPIR
jgi:alpha-tubulin suppressor-like RCC1 family protein